jgi:RimJ/RimL family protein N-acetyltransferase
MPARALRPGDEAALEEFLGRHLDSSMFLLSNLRTAGLEDRGAPYQATWAAWFEGERIEAVAAHAWNRAVLLQAPVRLGEVVRAAVAASPRDVGGFLGPWAQVEEARRSLGLEDEATQYEGREDRMALDLDATRVPDALASGEVVCRRAHARDGDLLGRWRMEFSVESLGATDTPSVRASYREAVDRQAAAGLLYVLEAGGRPVSTTAFNAWAADRAQVGGVWTPPAMRNRGYARAAVAGSLLDARARGATRGVLFTGNPAARRAYESIGFRVVGDYGIVLLARPVARAAVVDPR